MSKYTQEYFEKWEIEAALKKADLRDQYVNGKISSKTYKAALAVIRIRRSQIKAAMAPDRFFQVSV